MKLFISYRRGDTRDFAGRLADRLRQEPQIDEIFLDIDHIAAGENFKERIQKALKQSSACLVLIGDEWMGKSASDAPPRISDDLDFVRMEVREALNSGTRVIPVLVNNAPMPNSEDLPEEVRRLTELNAISMRHDSFRRDADFLADAVMSRKEPSWWARYWNRHPGQENLLRATSGLVFTIVLLIAGAAIYQSATGLALNQALGGTGQVVVLVAAVILFGIAAPVILGRRRRRRAT